MSGDRIGKALEAAYRSPANSPRELLLLCFPGADTRGLSADGAGVILDPRPGHEEQSPSLSLSVSKADGAAMFHRYGSDGAGMNALTWLETYGNRGSGMSRREAAALLISRAGIADTPREGTGVRFGSGSRPPLPRLGEQLRQKQTAAAETDPEKIRRALLGWEPLTGTEEGAPELEFLGSRGLLPALPLGFLEAFRFTGTDSRGRKSRTLPGSLLPGALGFKVPGLGGETAGLKFRNPGSKAELEAASHERGKAVRRYHIPSGLGTPPLCSRNLAESSAEVWTEGELNGVALMLAAHAAELPSVGVQGLAGADGSPEVRHLKPGKWVYIYADPDKAGNEARLRLGRIAADLGAEVYQLPAWNPDTPETDAAELNGMFSKGLESGDLSGAVKLGDLLRRNMEAAEQWTDPAASDAAPSDWGEGFTVWPYGIRNGETVELKRNENAEEGEEVRPLLGFTARIVSEVMRDDGGDAPAGAYVLEGWDTRGNAFPLQTVPLKDFASLNWADSWGARAFRYPGQAIKDKARAAVLRLSVEAGMSRETVYTHTGWRDIPEHGPVFLSAGACIGAAGAVEGLRVELTGRLGAYALPVPPEGEQLRQSVRESLELMDLAPLSLSVPLLGMTFRAPLGDVGFTVWASGRTGSGKTTYAALCQAHYGPEWTAKHLPASYQGTVNAVTREAYLARDVLFILDDFKPEGSQAEVKKAHSELSRLLASVGDRAGRSRMSADGMTVRAGYYPRGAVLTTAETTPLKTSDVARTVSVEVSAPLFGKGADPAASGRFEAARQKAAAGVYAASMSGYIRFLAEHHSELTGEPLRQRVRDSAALFAAPHNRTPENAAELLEGWRAFLTYAVSVEALSPAEAEERGERVLSALRELASGQAAALESTDPASRFLTLLGSLLRSGSAYVRDAETGREPGDYAAALGWQSRSYSDGNGETVTHWERVSRNGADLGYYGEVNSAPFLFLDRDAVYAAVNRAAEQGGHALPAPRTLWKLLRERLEPLGAMVCEKDRATYPRSVYGAGTADGRLSLLNISYPLPTNGTNGTDAEETESYTEKTSVPFLLFLSGQIKLNGTETLETPSQTEKTSVPFLPSASEPQSEPEEASPEPSASASGWELEL